MDSPRHVNAWFCPARSTQGDEPEEEGGNLKERGGREEEAKRVSSLGTSL